MEAANFEVQVGSMKLAADLPHHVHTMKYVKNHHYIELEDKAGNKHKVLATGLLKGECQACHYVFYSDTNRGDIRCPACYVTKVVWTLGKLQLCFIPEIESGFSISNPFEDDDEDI